MRVASIRWRIAAAWIAATAGTRGAHAQPQGGAAQAAGPWPQTADAPAQAAAPPALLVPPPPPPEPMTPGPLPPGDHPRWLDPEDDTDPRHSYREDGAGPRLSFGRAFPDRLAPGWYGRFETEYFDQEAVGRRRRQGAVVGMLLGIEGWGSPDGGGGGLPMTLYFGYRQPLFSKGRSPGLFFTGGLGWEWIVIDRIRSDTGFGIFVPLGRASFGVDLGGVRLLADGEIDYRWQWGAHDRRQLRAGVALSLHSELWDG